MRNPCSILNRWLFRDFPLQGFALLPRALGTILLFAFMPLLDDLDEVFGVAGETDRELFRLHPDGWGYSVYDATVLAGLSLKGLAAVYLVLCASLMAGWQVRWMALALLLSHHAFFVATPLYTYGFDHFALSALYYCALYSPRWGTPLLRSVQLHLCIVYLFAGLNKAIGPTWHDGEAVWRAAQQSFGISAVSVAQFRLPAWIWMAAGWATVALELAYPVLIWWRRTRNWILSGILLLHIGIALVMGLYAFSGLMMLLNLVAWFYPYSQSFAHRPAGKPVQAAGQPQEPAKNGCTRTPALSSIPVDVPPVKPP